MLKMRETYDKPSYGCIRKTPTLDTISIRQQCHILLKSINTHKLLNPSPLSPSTLR
jgi:hypothetical protein